MAMSSKCSRRASHESFLAIICNNNIQNIHKNKNHHHDSHHHQMSSSPPAASSSSSFSLYLDFRDYHRHCHVEKRVMMTTMMRMRVIGSLPDSVYVCKKSVTCFPSTHPSKAWSAKSLRAGGAGAGVRGVPLAERTAGQGHDDANEGRQRKGASHCATGSEGVAADTKIRKSWPVTPCVWPRSTCLNMLSLQEDALCRQKLRQRHKARGDFCWLSSVHFSAFACFQRQAKKKLDSTPLACTLRDGQVNLPGTLNPSTVDPIPQTS